MVTKTEVKEVSIYRRSATVIRAGIAKLQAGRNLVYIGGMTKTADAGTFLLKFPPAVKAVNMQIVNIDDVVSEEERESGKIQKQIAELAYRVNTCNMMEELRKTNCNFTLRTDITLEAQDEYLRKLPEELNKIHQEVNELTKEQERLNKELEEVKKEEEKPLIMVELIAENTEDLPFLLQYQENAANWSPKYEVRFSGTNQPLAVSMKAKINQSSKEDWKQVKVTLFSGNPVQTDTIPDLKSLQLSFYEPPQPSSPARGAMGMNMAASMAAGSAQAMSCAAAPAPAMMGMMQMAAMQTEEATVSEEESMTAFELPNQRDVLSDTSGNLADLKNFSVDAKYHVLCIPKMSTKCFMTAEIVSADWPLPPARASVYIKDTFAGEFYVDSYSETDTFILSLGNDERLKVVRTELPKKTQEALLKNQKKTSYSYKISILNNSSDSVDVKVLDQIPVSTEKTIVVETSALSGGKLTEESGELSWELSVESKKEKTIDVAYTVAWPKDKRLQERKVNISNSSHSGTCKCCGKTGVTGKFCPECGAVM